MYSAQRASVKLIVGLSFFDWVTDLPGNLVPLCFLEFLV